MLHVSGLWQIAICIDGRDVRLHAPRRIMVVGMLHVCLVKQGIVAIA
jgi:hypothetical protein